MLTLLQVRPSPCNVPWQFQTMSLLYKSFWKKYILFFPKSFPKVLTWTSLHWLGPNVMYAQLPWPRACSALIRWSKITCPLLESESPTEGHELCWKDVVLQGKQMFGLRRKLVEVGEKEKTTLRHAIWLDKTNDDMSSLMDFQIWGNTHYPESTHIPKSHVALETWSK